MRWVVERDMMGVGLDRIGTSSDSRAMKRKTRFIDLAGLRALACEFYFFAFCFCVFVADDDVCSGGRIVMLSTTGHNPLRTPPQRTPSRSKVYLWTIDFIYMYIYISFHVIYIPEGPRTRICHKNTCPHIPAHKYPFCPFLLYLLVSIVTLYSYWAVPASATTAASEWQHVDTFTLLQFVIYRDVYYSIKYCIWSHYIQS
jgi:hypothetical protein